MKDIKISPDEVHDYLEEIEETIQSQKEVEKALGEWCFCFMSFWLVHELLCWYRLFVGVAESAPYPDIDDENIEEEFLKLEMELESESSQARPTTSDTADSLADMFSELKLSNTKQILEEQATEPVRMKDGGKKILEAA